MTNEPIPDPLPDTDWPDYAQSLVLQFMRGMPDSWSMQQAAHIITTLALNLCAREAPTTKPSDDTIESTLAMLMVAAAIISQVKTNPRVMISVATHRDPN